VFRTVQPEGVHPTKVPKQNSWRENQGEKSVRPNERVQLGGREKSQKEESASQPSDTTLSAPAPSCFKKECIRSSSKFPPGRYTSGYKDGGEKEKGPGSEPQPRPSDRETGMELQDNVAMATGAKEKKKTEKQTTDGPGQGCNRLGTERKRALGPTYVILGGCSSQGKGRSRGEPGKLGSAEEMNWGTAWGQRFRRRGGSWGRREVFFYDLYLELGPGGGHPGPYSKVGAV